MAFDTDGTAGEHPAPRPPSGRRAPIRWVLSWAAVGVPVAVVAAVLVHVVDTAPEAFSAVPALLRMVLAVVLVLAILAGAIRAVLMEDPRLVVAIPVFAVAAGVAYPMAPTWVPGATVTGTYTLQLGGGATIRGALSCEWLPGRYRMGTFAAAAPAALPDGERITLHGSFTLPAVWLDRAGIDGDPRAPYVDPRATVLTPPRDANLEPQRSTDGRLGRTELSLALDASRPPSGAGDTWESPFADDPLPVRPATLTWSCDLP